MLTFYCIIAIHLFKNEEFLKTELVNVLSPTNKRNSTRTT